MSEESTSSVTFVQKRTQTQIGKSHVQLYKQRETKKKRKRSKRVFKELNKKVRFRMIRNHLPKKRKERGSKLQGLMSMPSTATPLQVRTSSPILHQYTAVKSCNQS